MQKKSVIIIPLAFNLITELAGQSSIRWLSYEIPGLLRSDTSSVPAFCP